MGGRGRGRAALSFNVESLGIQQGEALPGPVLQPPPAYPPLENSTAPIYPSIKFGETLQYKKDFLNFFSRLKVDIDEVAKPGYKRKLDSTNATVINKKDRPQLNYDWSRFPMELRPGQTRKANKVPKVKIKSMADIDKMLAQLEQKETNGFTTANESIVKVEKDQEDEAENEDRLGDDEVEMDSDLEMDAGTDYNCNYFDNGESYLDDDDDGDDGPVY